MQPEQPARFVFVDVEATGLDHGRHEMTEIAWIVRHEDGREEERQFFPFHTTDGADPDALELTRYDERIAPRRRTPMSEWLPLFLRDANQAIIVGAVPDFDARHLERACHRLGVKPTWDHHLLDVETLALPLIATGPERPRSLARTCEALGVPFERDQAHGALYDARLAKAVFDRVWKLLAALGTDEPVADRVPTPVEVTVPPPDEDPSASDDTPTEEFTQPRPTSDHELEPEPEVYETPVPTSAPQPEVVPLDPPDEPEPEPAWAPGPIRPFDQREPPDQPEPAQPAASATRTEPAPPEATRRAAAPLVEEAVTVLPKNGVEDSLFGGRPKRVGHPDRRDADDE